MGRKKDPIWFHFNSILKGNSGGVWAQCKYCGIRISGIVERLKSHHDSCDGKRAAGDDDAYSSDAESDNGNGSVSTSSIAGISKCLVCGSSAEESSAVDYNLTLWDANCSKSFCKLFNLQRSWHGMLLKASYCHKCHNILRDIDFGLRTLQLLEDKLQQSRCTVENLLTENYQSVKGREGEVYDAMEEDYTRLVKIFYRSVLPNNSDYEEEEEEVSPRASYIHKSDQLGQHSQETEHPPTSAYSNSGSDQYPEDADDLVEDPEPVDAHDPDPDEYEPQSRVEVIIKQDVDDGSDLSDPEVNTDDFSTPDDSSDEDWEMETKKKKGKVPVTPPPKFKIIKVLNPPTTPTTSNVRVIKMIKPKPKPSTPKVKVIKVLTPNPKSLITKRPGPLPNPRIPSGTPERRVIFVARSDSKRVVGGSTGHRPPHPHNQNAVGRMKCSEEGCTFTCSIPYKLDAHVNKVHKGDSKPFHCQTCTAKFGSNTTYYLHQKRCRDGGEGDEVNQVEEPELCTICQKAFPNRRQLKKHMAARHPIGNSLHCSTCSKMFEKQEELDLHEGVHKERIATMPFSCVFCDSGFTNSLDLKTHVRQEHEPSLQANKCKECGKVFLDEKRLRRHTLTVHTERSQEFKCTEVGCSFLGLNQKTLDKHITLHGASRDFICEICGQGYKAKSGLNYHMRGSHSTETRKYPCLLCDKRFTSGCLLKAHEESHNTVKTYICETCGKAFMTKKNLEQHNKSHLGIKIRYGKRFKNKGNNGENPPKRRRRAPPPSQSSRSRDDEEEEEEMKDEVSEASSSPSSVYERHEPPPDFDSTAGFQQSSLVPPPHFIMGGWTDRVTGQPPPGHHQFQSKTPTDSSYPYSTIDLSHTSHLLSVLHQQQQQRQGSSSQGHPQNYFNPRD